MIPVSKDDASAFQLFTHWIGKKIHRPKNLIDKKSLEPNHEHNKKTQEKQTIAMWLGSGF
jgi:hypothetical protein